MAEMEGQHSLFRNGVRLDLAPSQITPGNLSLAFGVSL